MGMDIRKITTQSRIKEGFIITLSTKRLSESTTNDIVNAAEISKKTFYNYYQNKHELLREIENELLSGLKQALNQDRKKLSNLGHLPKSEEIRNLANTAFDKTIAYCNEHKIYLSRLLSDNGDIRFLQMIVKLANDEFDARVPYLFGNIKIVSRSIMPFTFIKTIYVNTIINLLMLWESDPDSLSTNDIKDIAGLLQTKSPVDLIDMYKEYFG